jgi:CMP-N-acetylneuraminic acid synthetase
MSKNGKTIVALLPMKAHSERVKGKNFRELAGKPLYRWILDTLLEIPCLDRVVINTDARSILEQGGLVESERVMIRDRKPELCGDLVSMNLILGDDVANVPADIYLMTHTTNPLLAGSTIAAALERYEQAVKNGEADSLFTVNKIQTRFYREDGSAVNHDPDNLIRTQDLEPWYEENSNLYIFGADSFAATNARIGRRPIMFETAYHESFDIDTSPDWFIVDAIARRLQQTGGKLEA